MRWVVDKVPGNTKQWSLLGRHVAPKCLASLCGIHSRRLLRARQGDVDHRFGCNGAAAKLHPYVIAFFQFTTHKFVIPSLQYV